jgi:hypothetical protein
MVRGKKEDRELRLRARWLHGWTDMSIGSAAHPGQQTASPIAVVDLLRPRARWLLTCLNRGPRTGPYVR